MLAPALTLALALGGVAHAGCEKDTDCKGDRICSAAGACVAPTPTGCDKDTDCPGDQICSAGGSCAVPGAAGSAPQAAGALWSTSSSATQPAGGSFLSTEESWSFPSRTALANYERLRVTTTVNRLTSTNTSVSGGVVGVGPLAVGGGGSARVSEEGTRVRWVDGTGVTFNTDAALFDRVDARDWHLSYVAELDRRGRPPVVTLKALGWACFAAGAGWAYWYETGLYGAPAMAVAGGTLLVSAAKVRQRYRGHPVPHRATIQAVDAYNRALATRFGAAVEPGSMPDSAATVEQAYAEIKDKRSRQERR